MSVSIKKTIELNIAQESVLNSIEKRILVLAGPGAGKTLVIKEWIKRKLTEDTRKSYNILGLTFTNKAAHEMNNRLAEDVIERSRQVSLMTFHGFCAKVLRQYGHYMDIPANFNICSEQEELIEILKSGVKKADIEDKYNWKEYLRLIDLLKRNAYTPDEGELKDEKHSRLNSAYKAYEKELKESGYLDFNDLLLKTYKLLESYPRLAKHYQKIYPYICIDELQDTNKLQYLILNIVINEDTTLLAVGDDNQVIYEWNGASHKRLQTFKEYHKPQVIHLPLNYRCPASIVDVSNKLIAKNNLRLEDFKPNKAYTSREGDVVKVKKFDTFQNEIIGIADDIKKEHQEHLGQVTILARRKKLLDKMSEALQKQNISHRVYSRKGEFVSAPLAWLNEILHLFNSPNRERSLKTVIGAFNQMANLNIDFSTIKNRKDKEHDTTLLSIWLDEVNQQLQKDSNHFSELIHLVETKLSIKTYKSFYTKIFKWFDDYKVKKSEETLKEKIYNYDEYKDEKKVWHNLSREAFKRLGDEIPLSTFLQELALTTKETSVKSNEISLMTIHASKGQGFEHVYLIGMVNDELPSYYAIKSNTAKAMEEERRNCYVAITRASQTLTLSFADQYFDWAKKPSDFLHDMELLGKS